MEKIKLCISNSLKKMPLQKLLSNDGVMRPDILDVQFISIENKEFTHYPVNHIIIVGDTECKKLVTDNRENLALAHIVCTHTVTQLLLAQVIENAVRSHRNGTGSLQYRIASSFSESETMLSNILTYLRSCHGVNGENALFRISLILREIIANSILHGNGGIREKHIDCVVTLNPETRSLWIKIQDEGCQTNLGQYYERSGIDLELRDHFHGIDIINNFCSSVALDGNNLKISIPL